MYVELPRYSYAGEVGTSLGIRTQSQTMFAFRSWVAQFSSFEILR